MKTFILGFFRVLNDLLQAPQKVVWICLGLIMINCVADSSLMRLWALHRDHRQLELNIGQLEGQNQELKRRLARAKDPAFLEREARDRFDLVSEGDLVFVFSEDE